MGSSTVASQLLAEIERPSEERSTLKGGRGTVLLPTTQLLESVTSTVSTLIPQLRCADESPKVVDVLQAAIDAMHAAGRADDRLETLSLLSRRDDDAIEVGLARACLSHSVIALRVGTSYRGGAGWPRGVGRAPAVEAADDGVGPTGGACMPRRRDPSHGRGA